MEFLAQYNLTGLVMGLIMFLIIGVYHPIVIKSEYYFGIKVWWVFLLIGIAGIVASVLVCDVVLSILLGVFAFTNLWAIKELFEQRERVKKGWFPKNPNRKA